MLFNSLQFLVFFLVITLLYFQLKEQRSRVWMLLLGSCYFYMSFVPVYILILGFTIVIDYFAGHLIARKSGHARRWWLIVSIIANVGILAYYKYANFLIENISVLIHLKFPDYNIPLINIILPIGLSFHTFQAMSYTIEVYRGNQPPEKNFVVYALYVMFYPQLVAGPIERPQNLLHQFHEYKKYDWDDVKEGLSRMLWGFFKKVVIADRLAIAVDYSFNNAGIISWQAMVLGAVFYSFQIYCDFSGYSDIGIGAARVMGFKLMDNFNQPYLSDNISVFWSRWHISLSTWFRDYVYIPLGGNRKGPLRRRINVFIVFLLSGLWHGANWTFVMWGGLHGLFVSLFSGKKEDNGRRKSMLRTSVLVLLNFILVTVLWVFFRSHDINAAINYISAIVHLQPGLLNVGLDTIEIIFAVLLIMIMLWRENKIKGFSIKSNSAFYFYFLFMVFVCYFFGIFEESQFIYFQF